jgi:hypothetical protein
MVIKVIDTIFQIYNLKYRLLWQNSIVKFLRHLVFIFYHFKWVPLMNSDLCYKTFCGRKLLLFVMN